MVERIRIGVIGAGLIAQWEHIPNLVRLADRFLVAGICDPSAATHLTIRQSGFGEAFVRELEAFWSSIATGAPVKNSVEQAKRALLCALARHAAGRGIHDRRPSTDSGTRPTGRSGLTSHQEAVA
jgi:predicted dehydrogenase